MPFILPFLTITYRLIQRERDRQRSQTDADEVRNNSTSFILTFFLCRTKQTAEYTLQGAVGWERGGKNTTLSESKAEWSSSRIRKKQADTVSSSFLQKRTARDPVLKIEPDRKGAQVKLRKT